MTILPDALTSLIDALSRLPGVGPRTAERYAYYLLKQPDFVTSELTAALSNLRQNIKVCPVTFTLINSSQDVSPLYSDPARQKKLIAVVAEPFDVVALEKTNQFKGTYHVLGGLISPIDGIQAEDLRINELVRRVRDDQAEEVILATNASVEGETTALYIQDALKDLPAKLTRLARGLPIGVDLEYADQITLSRALEGRQALI